VPLCLNPAGAIVDRGLDFFIRPRFFKGIRFDTPEGDTGWFGPGSAVWYVHSHFPALTLGLGAAALIESLHPDFAWMGYDHTHAIERVDGVPTGRFLPEGILIRGGHSLAFFTGVAYGPTATAERVSETVRAMHHRVRGTRPDGRNYDADDPETLRWAYATVVWGIATAHERYHARPLKDIDRYYREFVQVGEALGGVDLPDTKQSVADYLLLSAPLMGVTMPTIAAIKGLPALLPRPLRPAIDLAVWTMMDLQPEWAQDLLRVAPINRIEAALRRSTVRVTLNAAHFGTGGIREARVSRMRTAQLSTSTPRVQPAA
jgi:uncharacterized protein (DUF2236 family)